MPYYSNNGGLIGTGRVTPNTSGVFDTSVILSGEVTITRTNVTSLNITSTNGSQITGNIFHDFSASGQYSEFWLNITVMTGISTWILTGGYVIAYSSFLSAQQNYSVYPVPMTLALGHQKIVGTASTDYDDYDGYNFTIDEVY